MEEEKQRSIVELPSSELMQLESEKQEPTPTPPPVVQPAPPLPKAKVEPGGDYQEPEVDGWTDPKPEAVWADESDVASVTDGAAVADVRPKVSDIGDQANGANKPYGVSSADEAIATTKIIPVGEPAPEFGNMQEVLDWLSKRKAAIHLPTKEEMEKERRRRKTEGIISALADGASAVSNLIFTTQYAPDMYRPENSMTEKMKERYNKLKKERDADADRYFNYAMMIGKIKDAQEAKDYQRGRDALQDRIRMSQEKRAELKADRDAAKAEYEAQKRQLDLQFLQGKIDRNSYLTEQEKLETEYMKKHGMKMPTTPTKSSSGSSGKGGGKVGSHPWRDDKGVFGTPGKVYYETSSSAAQEKASMHGGTYVTSETIRTTYGPNGETVSYTNKSTKGKKKQKAKNPMYS